MIPGSDKALEAIVKDAVMGWVSGVCPQFKDVLESKLLAAKLFVDAMKDII